MFFDLSNRLQSEKVGDLSINLQFSSILQEAVLALPTGLLITLCGIALIIYLLFIGYKLTFGFYTDSTKGRITMIGLTLLCGAVSAYVAFQFGGVGGAIGGALIGAFVLLPLVFAICLATAVFVIFPIIENFLLVLFAILVLALIGSVGYGIYYFWGVGI